MTAEFEQLRNDPDLEAEPGPGGTLIFQDGGGYCVVGPEFVSVEESDCYAYGETPGYMRMVADAYEAWERLWRDEVRNRHRGPGQALRREHRP